MLRRFLLAGVLALLLLGGTDIRSEKTVAAQGSPTQVLALVNQVRAEHGLPPYTYNPLLATAAQGHAQWMAANVSYTHTGAGGSTPQSRASAAGYVGYVAENIVGGTNMSANQGVIWWRNSPIHYSMMVSNRYVEAGVGVASNGTQNMYVLLMGRPSTRAPAGPAEEDTSAAPLIITPIQLAQPRDDGSIVHVVQEGQALWQIAAHYEVNVRDLFLYNGMDEDDFLQPGDEVIVRLAEGQPPPPTPTPPLTHKVREGDNAWIIAARYNVDLDTFFYLNGMAEDTVLQPGDEVRIRLAEGEPPPPTPTPQMSHIVQSGDSAWSIAARYGLTVEQLLALNGLTEDAVLRPGDELFIRATFTPTPEPATAAPTTPAPAGTGPTGTPLPTVTPTPAATLTPTPTAGAEASPPAGELGRQMGIGTFFLLSVGLAALIGVAGAVIRRN